MSKWRTYGSTTGPSAAYFIPLDCEYNYLGEYANKGIPVLGKKVSGDARETVAIFYRERDANKAVEAVNGAPALRARVIELEQALSSVLPNHPLLRAKS